MRTFIVLLGLLGTFTGLCFFLLLPSPGFLVTFAVYLLWFLFGTIEGLYWTPPGRFCSLRDKLDSSNEFNLFFVDEFVIVILPVRPFGFGWVDLFDFNFETSEAIEDLRLSFLAPLTLSFLKVF